MKKMRKITGGLIFDVFNYVFLFAIIIIMAYPMLHVVAMSLSKPGAITAGEVSWFPRGFNINGYQYLMKDEELLNAYKNTIIYSFLGTFFTLTFTSLAAYPLSLSGFVLKKPFTFYLAITMFFSGGLIPTYLWIKDLKLLNTIWVMVLPGCISAYTVFVFRSFFQSIPGSLRESAYIDGANDVLILFKIILPLSKPLLATFFLFTMVERWNSWFDAMMYLNDKTMHPLQMVLRRLVVLTDPTRSTYAHGDFAAMVKLGHLHPKNTQMAAVVLAMIPILCVYPYIQKHFTKGVMIGAIKG